MFTSQTCVKRKLDMIKLRNEINNEIDDYTY